MDADEKTAFNEYSRSKMSSSMQPIITSKSPSLTVDVSSTNIYKNTDGRDDDDDDNVADATTKANSATSRLSSASSSSSSSSSLKSLLFDPSDDDNDSKSGIDDDDDDDDFLVKPIFSSTRRQQQQQQQQQPYRRRSASTSPDLSTNQILNLNHRPEKNYTLSTTTTTSQTDNCEVSPVSDYFEEQQAAIEQGTFFCCYLLRSQNDDNEDGICMGGGVTTYIGATKNPFKRWRQHNGMEPGGAEETKTNRPWEIIAIVDGFCDDESSKKFEKAWQTPESSLRIRNKIGDYWAKDLVEKEINHNNFTTSTTTLYEKRGLDGNFATLKCLLNECHTNDFQLHNLRVNFFHGNWMDAFLKTTYQNDTTPRFPMFPINIVTSQSYEKEFERLKQQTFTNQGFRWELLDGISATLKNHTEILPDHWLKLHSFCSALQESNRQRPFLDEYSNQILNDDDEILFSDISERAMFYNLKKAIVINPHHEETFILNSHYKERFQEFSISNNEDHHSSDTATIEQFMNKEEKRLKRLSRSREPGLWWNIHLLIEKMQHVQTVAEPNRQVVHHSQNLENSRYRFTPEQESIFQRFHGNFGAISDALDRNNLRLGLTSQQIKNKIKNDAKNLQKTCDHRRRSRPVVSSNDENENEPVVSRPRKKRKEFTGDEDDAILNGISMYSKNDRIEWSKILTDNQFGPCLEGRTALAIRKRYENVLKDNPRGLRVVRHF